MRYRFSFERRPPRLVVKAETAEHRERLRRYGFGRRDRSDLWDTPHLAVARKFFGKKGHPKLATWELAEQHLIQRSFSTGAEEFGENRETTKWGTYPFQQVGVEELIARGFGYLGDQMRLGKTVQACRALRHWSDNRPSKSPCMILVVCPAGVKYSWKRHLVEWGGFPDMWIHITQGRGVLCTSLALIIIINYDVLADHYEELQEIDFLAVVLDEAHKVKNPKARRTCALLGGHYKPSPEQKRKGVESKYYKAITAPYRVALSGTPMPNGRPIELQPILKWLDPTGWPLKRRFEDRYCGMYKDHFGRWDNTGSSNVEELQHKLRATVLIRRKRREVMPWLPPITREVLEVDIDRSSWSAKKKADSRQRWERQQQILSSYKDRLTDAEWRKALLNIPASMAEFEELSALAKEQAVEKVPAMIAFLKDALEAGEKILFFAWHQEVTKAVYKAFRKCAVIITGSTSDKRKDEACHQFQTDKDTLLMVGNVQAAGIGIRLDAADHVIFGAMPWVPDDVEQAEHRAISMEKHKPIFVQYLVVPKSLEAYQAHTFIRKLGRVEKALDKRSDANG
jgi:SWI/SNF-related matrix-associated actin-dependent regulator 1 of chromatin subfamily A